MPNGRCRMHRGKASAGIANGNYKHGRNSKYLTAIPQRIQADFEALRDRDDLLRLSDDIALIDSRILDVLRRTDSGEAGHLWLALQKAYKGFTAAKSAGDVKKMGEALVALDDAIKLGVSDYQAWAEVKHLIEQRRRLVESERKREVEQMEILTGREAAALFNALLSIVNEHVTDRGTKQRIQTAVTGLLSGEVRGGLRLVEP